MPSAERARKGVDQALLLLFDFGDGVGVEKLTQVGFAKQFTELILVDSERLGRGARPAGRRRRRGSWRRS